MLRDLLSSFPLCRLVNIDRLFLGQLRVIVKYCKKLNEGVKDRTTSQRADE
jgi:hypothetical protein